MSKKMTKDNSTTVKQNKKKNNKNSKNKNSDKKKMDSDDDNYPDYPKNVDSNFDVLGYINYLEKESNSKANIEYENWYHKQIHSLN